MTCQWKFTSFSQKPPGNLWKSTEISGWSVLGHVKAIRLSPPHTGMISGVPATPPLASSPAFMESYDLCSTCSWRLKWFLRAPAVSVDVSYSLQVAERILCISVCQCHWQCVLRPWLMHSLQRPCANCSCALFPQFILIFSRLSPEAWLYFCCDETWMHRLSNISPYHWSRSPDREFSLK